MIGSRAHSASALALENVRFYVGSKTSHDIELASKNDVLSTVEIWEFGKRKNQELIYQSCEYQNTVLKIERALPAEITACSVTHPSVTDQSRENNPEPLIKSIDCK